MKSALTVLVLGFLTFSVALKSALAATASGSFGVSVSVPATCVASASSVGFGTYNGGVVNATSNVSLNCTDATPYAVSLDAGRASVAALQKLPALGLALHGYVHGTKSGETVNPVPGVGTNTVAGMGNGVPQVITVRGQIPAEHSIAAGDYPDSITVTITY